MPSVQHPTPSQAISESCPPTGRPDTKRWQTVSEGYRKNITHVHLLVSLRTFRINTGFLIRVYKGNCDPCVECRSTCHRLRYSNRDRLALGFKCICSVCTDYHCRGSIYALTKRVGEWFLGLLLLVNGAKFAYAKDRVTTAGSPLLLWFAPCACHLYFLRAGALNVVAMITQELTVFSFS